MRIYTLTPTATYEQLVRHADRPAIERRDDERIVEPPTLADVDTLCDAFAVDAVVDFML